jgi:uncharacterized OsmC-like protein
MFDNCLNFKLRKILQKSNIDDINDIITHTGKDQLNYESTFQRLKLKNIIEI